MSLTNVKRKFGYGQYSSDRFPYHCARTFHLRSGLRAYKVWKLCTGYDPPEEFDNPDVWMDFFPPRRSNRSNRSKKNSPTYVQLSLF